MNTSAIAFEIGAPVINRGSVGYVSAIRANDAKSYHIGAAGMVPIKREVEIVWESGRVSELPETIAAPYLIEAERIGLPPALNVEELKAEALGKQTREREEAIAKRNADAEARKAFLEDAKARVPSDAKAVILAELDEDESDSMSDYFNARTVRTVILGFSKHSRDLFPELRKHAALFDATAHLASAPESAEHREKWSMGAGYYLKTGSRYSSGWKVCKRRLWNGLESLPSGEWLEVPKAETATPGTPATGNGAACGFTIEEHTHTKKGFGMFIAVMASRVKREAFDLFRNRAEAIGGWYSRPWGKTPGGFAFKSRDAAEQFVRQSESNFAPVDCSGAKPVPEIAAKLRALADGMQAEIDSRFAPRLANTPKRQREAASARIEGAHLERTQKALRKLADAHDAGNVSPLLFDLRTKTAIHKLTRSEIDRSNAGYYDAGIDTNRPAEQSDKARKLWELLGAPSEEKVKAEELRRKSESLMFAKIPGFFPTPPDVFARMIEAAELPSGPCAILEPSAGSGAILDALREAAPLATCEAFEIHSSLREVLTLKGYTLTGSDFTEATPEPRFDRVLMNPPFEGMADAAHVTRALRWLKPGGVLVAIMSPSAFFRSDAKAEAFRDLFDLMSGTKEELPPQSFKASGTGVATVLITLRR